MEVIIASLLSIEYTRSPEISDFTNGPFKFQNHHHHFKVVLVAKNNLKTLKEKHHVYCPVSSPKPFNQQPSF